MPATRLLEINAKSPNADIIHIAADAIRAGKLVAFPTETVYGLGANALDKEAINLIYEAKQRPSTDPVIAHICDIEQLEYLAIDVPSVTYELTKKFWPGPLTLVLKRAEHVPPNIATGRDTIAIRMPSNPIARELIKAANTPIAAPSANTFTRPSATTAAHVLEDLNGRVDIILDGGPTHIGLESTVLDMTDATPTVLRPGGITLADLQKIIPDVKIITHYVEETEYTTAPGQMLKHYSPNAQVKLFTGDITAVLNAMKSKCKEHVAKNQRVGIIVTDDDIPHFEQSHSITFSKVGTDIQTISHNIFAALRELDKHKVDVILVRDFGRDGIGAALWDRLVRAAEGQIISTD